MFFFIIPLCVDSLTTGLTILPISLGHMMAYDDKNRFKRFIHLDPPKFSGDIGKDPYKFLLDYLEWLFNLGSLEPHRVSYTTYQLTDAARQWWKFFY